MRKIINEVKPFPDRLSQWNNCNEMIYKCPVCGTSFNIYGNKQNFCHMCGQKLEWKDSPQYVSNAFKEKYWDLEKKSYSYKINEQERKQAKKYLTELLINFYLNKIN